MNGRRRIAGTVSGGTAPRKNVEHARTTTPTTTTCVGSVAMITTTTVIAGVASRAAMGAATMRVEPGATCSVGNARAPHGAATSGMGTTVEEEGHAASPTAEERRKNDLTLMFKLNVATMEQAASRIFNLQANKPSAAATPRSPRQLFQNVYRMVEEQGNESWFAHSNMQTTKVPRARTHPPIPVQRAYYRIKNAIPPVNSPTIQEVDDALSKLVNAASQPSGENVQPLMTASEPATPPSGENVQLQTTSSEPATPTPVAAQQITLPREEPARTPLQDTLAANKDGQVCSPTPLSATAKENLSGVANLFVTPEQGILSQPAPAPVKRGRRLSKTTVAVPSLRRSKRQAASRLKHMPAEQRANHVLCRRLGYIKDELTPAEEAIRDFIASFQGPMPQDIVAALTAMFHLDDEDACAATEALIRLGGPEAADGLPELRDDA
ncbi:unnamed protein product [Urochloa humidicola]